ncbi:PIN domain-containing protein [Tumidithrix elongata RA019]|uniref:PIN domain-containing protein n=1 Tax=Tumidithrix elongata BACA0141 TaxID=2716417 RepID=A0AAW9Q5M5_9CYAN|nr:PIN domain-containing protein [Tumidithrix elongata RA019]
MPKNIILDTSVLVALLSVRDNYHNWAKNTVAAIATPFLTCEAVLTETCFLLRSHDMGRREVLRSLQQGYIQIPFRLIDEINAINLLMQCYQNVPMSLADACLVRMSEIYENSAILTLDSDFKIYRKHRNEQIPVIMPEP